MCRRNDSAASTPRGRIQKRRLYEDAGVPEYWIVDGEDRTIRIVRPGQEDIVATESLAWHPAVAAEAFTLDVAAYFREALDDDASD